MNPAIRRYLNARGHIRFPPDAEKAEAHFESIIRRGYPDVETACKVVVVHSRQMRWEYRSTGAGDEVYIIADQGLSLALMELDYLARAPSFNPDVWYVRLHALMADYFRAEGNLALYRFCVVKASEHQAMLGQLRLDASRQRGASIPALVALLHEFAHLVVERDDPNTRHWRPSAGLALDKFADLNESILSGETNLDQLAHVDGLHPDDLDQPVLREQLASYIATVRGNAALQNELSCDLLAALAFVNLEAGANLLLERLPPRVSISAREFGDALYCAVTTIKGLQTLKAIEQLCQNLTNSTADWTIARPLIEVTARFNALTHLLNAFYVTATTQIEFAPNPPGYPTPPEARRKTLFIDSMARFTNLYSQRILNPVDAVAHFFNDTNSFPEEFIRTVGREFETYRAVGLDDLKSTDGLRDLLPG